MALITIADTSSSDAILAALEQHFLSELHSFVSEQPGPFYEVPDYMISRLIHTKRAINAGGSGGPTSGITQAAADARYRRNSVPISDIDLPASITRDTEVPALAQPAIDVETAARTAADTVNSDAIAAETTARQTADTANSDAIAAETAARTAADTVNADAIAAETTARQTADADHAANNRHLPDPAAGLAGQAAIINAAGDGYELGNVSSSLPEFATLPEVTAGTINNKPIAPDTLKVELDKKQDLISILTAIRDAATAEDDKFVSERSIRLAIDSIPGAEFATPADLNAGTDATKALASNVVKPALDLKQDLSERRTDIRDTPNATNDQYASEKAIRDALDAIPAPVYADDTETRTGTEENKAVSPARLRTELIHRTANETELTDATDPEKFTNVVELKTQLDHFGALLQRWQKDGFQLDFVNSSQVANNAGSLISSAGIFRRINPTNRQVEEYSYPAENPVSATWYDYQGNVITPGLTGSPTAITVRHIQENGTGALRTITLNYEVLVRIYRNPFTGDWAYLIPSEEDQGVAGTLARAGKNVLAPPAVLSDYFLMGAAIITRPSSNSGYNARTSANTAILPGDVFGSTFFHYTGSNIESAQYLPVVDAATRDALSSDDLVTGQIVGVTSPGEAYLVLSPGATWDDTQKIRIDSSAIQLLTESEIVSRSGLEYDTEGIVSARRLDQWGTSRRVRRIFNVATSFDLLALGYADRTALWVRNINAASGIDLIYGPGDGSYTLHVSDASGVTQQDVVGEDAKNIQPLEIAVVEKDGTDIYMSIIPAERVKAFDTYTNATNFGPLPHDGIVLIRATGELFFRRSGFNNRVFPIDGQENADWYKIGGAASDQADAWVAATEYQRGDIRSAPEPDTADPAAGTVFNWFHLNATPRTSGATFDTTEKAFWQRMSVQQDLSSWVTIDGDVAGLKLGVYGQKIRLTGGAATTSITFPTSGGTNENRDYTVLNDSVNNWQVNVGSANTREASSATNAPSTSVEIAPGEILTVVSVNAFSTIYSRQNSPAIDASSPWSTDTDYVGESNKQFLLVVPAALTTPFVTADGQTLTPGKRYNLQYAADRTAADSVAAIDDDAESVAEVLLMNLIGEVAPPAAGILERVATSFAASNTAIAVESDRYMMLSKAAAATTGLSVDMPDLSVWEGLAKEKQGFLVNTTGLSISVNTNGNTAIQNSVAQLEDRNIYYWRQTGPSFYVLYHVGRLDAPVVANQTLSYGWTANLEAISLNGFEFRVSQSAGQFQWRRPAGAATVDKMGIWIQDTQGEFSQVSTVPQDWGLLNDNAAIAFTQAGGNETLIFRHDGITYRFQGFVGRNYGAVSPNYLQVEILGDHYHIIPSGYDPIPRTTLAITTPAGAVNRTIHANFSLGRFYVAPSASSKSLAIAPVSQTGLSSVTVRPDGFIEAIWDGTTANPTLEIAEEDITLSTVWPAALSDGLTDSRGSIQKFHPISGNEIASIDFIFADRRPSSNRVQSFSIALSEILAATPDTNNRSRVNRTLTMSDSSVYTANVFFRVDNYASRGIIGLSLQDTHSGQANTYGEYIAVSGNYPD